MDPMIDWMSAESHLLLSPRMPSGERARLESLRRSAPDLPAHVWLATSGTTGTLKLVALSKRAMLASAESVNRRLESGKEDRWCCVLPTFHVGGLAIHARAHLSGASVVTLDWNPARFARQRMTLTSLVPAQLRDLVVDNLRPPESLRAVVIGAGALSDDLYARAQALGWPVLPSYGMTECCSQIATARHGSPELVLLPHLRARVEDDGRLAFAGSSLLTGYATESGFIDPKSDGWFVSDDTGRIEGDIIRVDSRASEFVKIGGESVDLRRLDAILDAVRGDLDAAVFPVTDERLGFVIHLASTAEDPSDIVEAFNARVFPFEQIRAVHQLATIPRGPLGKLLREQLRERSGLNSK